MAGEVMSDFSVIIRHPNFVRISAIIRTPFWSSYWKHAHADVPFWTLLDNVKKPLQIGDKEEVFGALSELLRAIADATERLRYSVEDIDWLVRTLDEPNWTATIWLLLAYGSAPDTLYSPSELAVVTEIAESTWRKYASNGTVPGAVKKGKQWLLPKSVLIAQELLSPAQADRIPALERDIIGEEEPVTDVT